MNDRIEPTDSTLLKFTKTDAGVYKLRIGVKDGENNGWMYTFTVIMRDNEIVQFRGVMPSGWTLSTVWLAADHLAGSAMPGD